MAYDVNVLKRANARLEQARQRRADDTAQLTRMVYEKAPRVAEIDRQLRRTIVDIVAASLKNADETASLEDIIRDALQLLMK